MDKINYQIDPNNIKDKKEFTTLFCEKFGKSSNTKNKLRDIFNYMRINRGNYNLSSIYYDICLIKYIPGGPGLDEVKHILDQYKERVEYYKNEPGKIHDKNGVWKCSNCEGRGILPDLNNSTDNYEFKKTCPTCEGIGMRLGFNYWDPFMTPEELKNDKSLNEIREILSNV